MWISLGTIVLPMTHGRQIVDIVEMYSCWPYSLSLVDLYHLLLWNAPFQYWERGEWALSITGYARNRNEDILPRSSNSIHTNLFSTYLTYSKIDSNIKGFDFNYLFCSISTWLFLAKVQMSCEMGRFQQRERKGSWRIGCKIIKLWLLRENIPLFNKKWDDHYGTIFRGKGHPVGFIENHGGVVSFPSCQPPYRILCFNFERDMVGLLLFWGKEQSRKLLRIFSWVSFSIIISMLTFHSNEILSTHVCAFRVTKPTI